MNGYREYSRAQRTGEGQVGVSLARVGVPLDEMRAHLEQVGVPLDEVCAHLEQVGVSLDEVRAYLARVGVPTKRVGVSLDEAYAYRELVGVYLAQIGVLRSGGGALLDRLRANEPSYGAISAKDNANVVLLGVATPALDANRGEHGSPSAAHVGPNRQDLASRVSRRGTARRRRLLEPRAHRRPVGGHAALQVLEGRLRIVGKLE